MKYDVRLNTFKKIYSLPEPEQQFVFANSIIIDSNTNSYYALKFPNDRFNNNLQLIKGSLSKPVYSLLGNAFPFSFNDVKSFADLYYCRKSNLLLAATLYTSKDNLTEVKVYSIHFPPNEITASDMQAGISDRNASLNLFYKLLLIGLPALVIFYILYKKYGKKKPEHSTAGKIVELPVRHSPYGISPAHGTFSAVASGFGGSYTLTEPLHSNAMTKR